MQSNAASDLYRYKKGEKMSSLEMKYFVLKPRSKSCCDLYAKASRIAIEAYAKAIRDFNPKLSFELSNWANKEHFRESELAINEKHSN